MGDKYIFVLQEQMSELESIKERCCKSSPVFPDSFPIGL